MRILLLAILTCIFRVGAAADYLNTQMLNIMQYERGEIIPDRANKIKQAFENCTDPDLRKLFLDSPYFDEKANNGKGTYVDPDSLRFVLRMANTGYFDLDGDAIKEVLFHEKNMDKGLQVSVILKKQGEKWELIYREFGVFTNMVFENRLLSRIVSVEYHANANPFNVFKIYTAKASSGTITVTPVMKINVPHHYRFPVKAEFTAKYIRAKTDTLYFYDKTLYNEMDFPYKKEMRSEFEKDQRFNSHESGWMDLVPGNYYFISYIESRGDFSSVLVAFNGSFITDFPEYLFLYLPNKYLEI